FSSAMVCVVAGLNTGKLFPALDRIRSLTGHSKSSALGKLWTDVLSFLCETHHRLLLGKTIGLFAAWPAQSRAAAFCRLNVTLRRATILAAPLARIRPFAVPS